MHHRHLRNRKRNGKLGCFHSSGSVRPKLYVGLRVRSKKQKDDIFGFNFHFDKEIPLLTIIGIAAGALAACIAIGALIHGIFKCKKCKCDEDCGE